MPATTPPVREVFPTVALEVGLGLSCVRDHLHIGLRLGDAGQRILAFYLVELEDRRLYQACGHASTVSFAEHELELDRRRTGELIRIGRKLLELPAIDAAFLAGLLGWSKLLLLTRVAVQAHDEAWLARAQALTCRDLAREVKLSRPGRPPRAPGERKGLPEVRFPVKATLDVLAWQKLELAKQKLAAELGRTVSDADFLDLMAEMALQTEEDGTIPGRTHVSASLYRIVLRPAAEPGARRDTGALVAETQEGLLPIDGGDDVVRSGAVRCDAACLHIHDDDDGTPRRAPDKPTPPALRARVIARDGGCCRSCGSRRGLMVHHIRFRSDLGPTVMWNLVTLCTSCHALVHAGLLVLRGRRADDIAFVDAEGRALGTPHAAGRGAPTLRLHRRAGATTPAPAEGGVSEAPVPAEIDVAWWRARAHLLDFRGDRGVTLRDGTPQAVAPRSASASAAAQAPEDAFAQIVGQSALVRRLAQVAAGRRARGRSYPHALFVGPPGTGKTTLARGVAASFGARLVESTGPLLQHAHALLRRLAELDEGDMLFLDEIHAIPQGVLELLYQAMAERRVPVTIDVAGRAYTTTWTLPRFTVLAATTEDGELPEALRSRFGLREHLGYYPREDLAALATRAAAREGATLEPEAAAYLAASARGTPREVLRLLDHALDRVAGPQAAVIDPAAVRATLRGLGYDEQGLQPSEQRYLALLRACRRPVPLGRLARMLGASTRTLLDHLEPFLFRRGLVEITPRGRVAVAAGCC